ncbi:MAG: hypothetical protein RL299_1012 [Pseudomonadota bacterium]|jgi:hypothetical protein
MKLPPIISKATLKGLASPDETHLVRVIAHEPNNPTVYRMRCRCREYRFERDGTVGKHILDIPVTLWMADTPSGSSARFRDNSSIAEDFRTGDRSPYSIHVIPISKESPVAIDHHKPDTYQLLRELLVKTGAPEYIMEAVKLADMGETNALRCYVDSLAVDDTAGDESVSVISSTPSTADALAAKKADQARKMREAKAAKKAEREAANLQPA